MGLMELCLLSTPIRNPWASLVLAEKLKTTMQAICTAVADLSQVDSKKAMVMSQKSSKDLFLHN
jgi:hypothetical protein